jgi:hypothetical protein
MRGRAGVLLAGLLAITAWVGVAQADLTDPNQAQGSADRATMDTGEFCSQDVGGAAQGQGIGCDTEYTPVAKDGSSIFTPLSGAAFGAGGSMVTGSSPSPAPSTVDFFGQSFLDENHGFFAGAACTDPQTKFADLDRCDRVPAIYEYKVDPGQPPVVQQVLGPEATNEHSQGYVSAIAWIDPNTALAVGGTGAYPRREDQTGADPAGTGRAWLFHQDGGNGSWTELEALPELAGQPMGGLTALACSPRAGDGGLCVAGGRGQLWLWRDGGFVSGTSLTPAEARVRSIVTWPGTAPVPDGKPWFIAGGGSGTGSASFWIYDGKTWQDGQGWVRSATLNYPSGPDTPYSLFVEPTDYKLAGSRPVGRGDLNVILSPGGPPDPTGNDPRSRIVVGANNNTGGLGAGSTCGLCTNTGSVDGPYLTRVRLVAADGDLSRARADALGEYRNTVAGTAPDGIVDWAVGSLPGHDGVYTREARGAAYSTVFHGSSKDADIPSPSQCVADGELVNPTSGSVDTTCKTKDPSALAGEFSSRSLYELPTYALNSFAYIHGAGTAFAVGDRGAILRLGGAGSVGSGVPEPGAPRLGAHVPAPAPDERPFASAGPSADGEVGPVPSLAEQPQQPLKAPRLIPSGSPEPTRPLQPGDNTFLKVGDVKSIVMSRDGSEGWAVGSGASPDPGGQGILFHYDGERWRSCDTDGISGVVPPDSACASLQQLRFYKGSDGVPSPVQLTGMARIPFENDPDPANDDRFEVEALGTLYRVPHGKEEKVMLRYSSGKWSIDTDWMDQVAAAAPGFGQARMQEVAFTSPDDGWIEAEDSQNFWLLRLVPVKGWVLCMTNSNFGGSPSREACDDTANAGAGVLSIGPGGATQSHFLTTAGARVYLAGRTSGSPSVPAIFHKDPGEPWTQDFAADQSSQGTITSISVARNGHGDYFGWAFDQTDPLLRLDPSTGTWRTWPSGNDALADYGGRGGNPGDLPAGVLSIVGPGGDERSFVTPAANSMFSAYPLLGFDSAKGRWSAVPTPFLTSHDTGSYRASAIAGQVRAVAGDNKGGFWIAVREARTDPGTYAQTISFYHYTDQAPTPVFTDAPHPIREPITSASPGTNGQLWVATSSSTVYRYDRVTGWHRLAIRGWDPGRVSTSPSAVNAIAVGADGSGVAVGDHGRIADLTDTGSVLDRATGALLCSKAGNVPPCDTGFDLKAAAVAPDGSALVGGEARSLLWRPANGDFRAVMPPGAPVNATITGIAMPKPEEAWVVTGGGQIFVGKLDGGDWSWHLEDLNSARNLVTLDSQGNGTPLNAVAVGPDGHGYAVGQKGVIVERTGDADSPWRRIDGGVLENLYSVALPSNGRGDGALIGGQLGLILTGSGGHFSVARTDDVTDPLTAAQGTRDAARIVGVALLPGTRNGDVEAWAASQGRASNVRSPGPEALLHFTNSDSPLLDGGFERVAPLSDSPSLDDDALSFAAFGRSDCHLLDVPDCPEPQGTTLTNEIIQRRIADGIAAGGNGAGAPKFALFTGDIDPLTVATAGPSAAIVFRRWTELVAPLFGGGRPPLFGALGSMDRSNSKVCPASQCLATGVGTSSDWTAALAAMPAPWGGGPQASYGGLTFEPVGNESDSIAHTHYAFDVVRGGRPLARVVVVDNSLRSLEASDADQNPREEEATWLDRTLSSRSSGERAVVVANTPAYAYQQDASNGGLETAQDAATFEQLLLKNKVDVVVSGKLGWNGLYYTYAAGVHCPTPGGDYPDPAAPPAPASAACSGSPTGGDVGADANKTLSDAENTASCAATSSQTGDSTCAGAMPTVVASGAGGTFGPANHPADTGDATTGYWHGYSLIHLSPDTGRVVVEQRPILDWIGISGDRRVLRPGQVEPLQGYGREAAGADTPLKYDEISNYAVTHRFDLVYADPAKPWLPKKAADGDPVDKCHPYLCIPHDLGLIDPQSGKVHSQSGDYPRTYAIAILSVGRMAATWPLVFEPRPSFHITPLPEPTPAPPIAAPPASPPTPSAPTSFGQPPPPAVPSLPPPPAEQPLTPPAPPVPPASGVAQLDLFTAPPVLSVAPTVSLFPPAPPVINVAPPTPARPIEKAKKVAVQSSGSDSGAEDKAVDPSDAHGSINPMDSPDKAATRLEPDRNRHAFTALSHRDQTSAWVRDLQWGGGMTLIALTLTFGWITARPTPRRRQPVVPAPGWVNERRLR